MTIADDHANEGREAFAVALTNPVGGPLLGTAATTVSIAPSNGRVIDAAAVRPNKPSAVFFDGPGTIGDSVTVTPS